MLAGVRHRNEHSPEIDDLVEALAEVAEMADELELELEVEVAE